MKCLLKEFFKRDSHVLQILLKLRPSQVSCCDNNDNSQYVILSKSSVRFKSAQIKLAHLSNTL